MIVVFIVIRFIVVVVNGIRIVKGLFGLVNGVEFGDDIDLVRNMLVVIVEIILCILFMVMLLFILGLSLIIS